MSNQEIEEARKRDRPEQERFHKKVDELAKQFRSLEKMPTKQVPTLLQGIQSLIEDAASIGGEALSRIPDLEKIEDDFIQQLNSAMPEGKEMLAGAKSLSAIERIPYLAQRKRRDTPILENEEVPTLLSEDFATISLIGYVSRSFPDFKPSKADIEKHLDEAVRQGFSNEQAQQILKVWNENK